VAEVGVGLGDGSVGCLVEQLPAVIVGLGGDGCGGGYFVVDDPLHDHGMFEDGSNVRGRLVSEAVCEEDELAAVVDPGPPSEHGREQVLAGGLNIQFARVVRFANASINVLIVSRACSALTWFASLV
jgi:hypothetical protein